MIRSSDFLRGLFALALALLLPVMGFAQAGPFTGGWVLQTEASSISLQSVKNDTKVEISSIVNFTGSISEHGAAQITIAMDSVDTKIDLRNVRMRFLLFETFKFPTSQVTLQLDPAQLADLPSRRRMTVPVTYQLTLHGVTAERTADVTVTLLDDNTVAVASAAPIIVPVADFDMAVGVTKLEETAKVKIVPSGTITFDFLFRRAGTAGVVSEPAPAEKPADAALEAKGDFDAEACLGRFEILSRAGNITFKVGSARLDASSGALLDTLLDVIQRCPGMKIEVGGHTDDTGGDAANQALSEKRAASVVDYLAAKGVATDRLAAKGYGEAVPLLANDSAENRGRNRRIEFKVIGNG